MDCINLFDKFEADLPVINGGVYSVKKCLFSHTMQRLFIEMDGAIKDRNPKKIAHILKNIFQIYNEETNEELRYKYDNRHDRNKEMIQDYISQFERYVAPNNIVEVDRPQIIFLSHSHGDKSYSDAIMNFIVGLNIDKKQLLYTTDDEYSIPNRKHMFDHLRTNIHKNTYMIILWSERYLNNPTCLCELGASWILGIETMNIFTPQFNFNDEKYLKCPPNMREEMGIKLVECSKTRVRGLKDEIVKKFNLQVSDGLAEKTVNDFIAEVTQIKAKEEYGASGIMVETSE